MSLATAKIPIKDLKLEKCLSRVEPLSCDIAKQDDLENLLREKMKGDAIVVLWLMQGIVWGKWQNGHLDFPDPKKAQLDYLDELRVFNDMEEIHLQRFEEGYCGRYRMDENVQDGPDEYMDSFSRFWGEKDIISDGYATLVDSSRKMRMVVPVEEVAQRYGLQTRNYVGSDDNTGLSGYIDYRFVHIASMGGEING